MKAPAVVCATFDGGRMQRCDLPETAKSHWCETKVGALLELEAAPHADDPCPELPDTFRDPAQMEKLTREIHLAAAEKAGRTRAEGGPVYLRWITAIWQGRVSEVIAEVAARAVELGSPPPNVGETDPRKILAGTLTYLVDQQSRMNYPTYRRMGLPITSSHIESTVEQIGRRVKGSEKFWCETGGEAMRQLRADQLGDTQPLAPFWTRRNQRATGTRTYDRAA